MPSTTVPGTENTVMNPSPCTHPCGGDRRKQISVGDLKCHKNEAR